MWSKPRNRTRRAARWVGEAFLTVPGDQAGLIRQIGGQSCKFGRLALVLKPQHVIGEFEFSGAAVA